MSTPNIHILAKPSEPEEGINDPPSRRIFFRKANTRHAETESRLWKCTASQLFSVEDGLLIFFGFISGFAIASNFSQILGLFR